MSDNQKARDLWVSKNTYLIEKLLVGYEGPLSPMDFTTNEWLNSESFAYVPPTANQEAFTVSTADPFDLTEEDLEIGRQFINDIPENADVLEKVKPKLLEARSGWNFWGKTKNADGTITEHRGTPMEEVSAEGYTRANYRELIEIPEDYELVANGWVDTVDIVVPLEKDGTMLRKFAFTHIELYCLEHCVPRGFDCSAREKVQDRVNAIVKDWRERFGTP